MDCWIQLQRQFHGMNISVLSVSSSSSFKAMKFRCTFICGGLGDRLRNLLMTYLFAILSNRQRVVDKERSCTFANYFQPNIYPWKFSSNYPFEASRHLIQTIHHNEHCINRLKTTPFLDR